MRKFRSCVLLGSDVHGTEVKEVGVRVVAVDFKDFGDESPSGPSFDVDDNVKGIGDVRLDRTGALTFAIPGVDKKGALSWATKDWSLEALAVARSGFPFNGTVLTATIGGVNPRPDRIAGQPVWIPNASAGGGESLNPLAFTPAPAGQQGTEGRNDIPGFGLTQVDLSLGRKFSLTERMALQFRTDAFNLFNHPNFANPLAFIGSGVTFLSSPSMANQGLGGLNSVFQQGGPRSLQLSLKLSF